MLKVLEHRDYYGQYISEYDANVYIKGSNHVKKKNILYKYAPDILYLDRKGQNTFVESLAQVHFSSPNFFTQQIIAINGTKMSANDIQERVMQFLNVNIYNPTIFNDKILFPAVEDAARYYRFEYISQQDTLDHTIHKIRIIPKIRSQKLISGYIYIVDRLWSVFKFEMKGQWEFSQFWVETEFGMPDKDFLLPLNTRIAFDMKLLGNEVMNYYFSSFEYTSVKKYDPDIESPQKGYDLSDYFSVYIDSFPIIKDEEFWEENRPVPLTSYEEIIVEENRQKEQNRDTTSIPSKNSWIFARGIITPKRFKYNDANFRYSGLINPFKLAYSKRDGIVYWQQLRSSKRFNNGKELRITPNVGILFQKRELYFNTPVGFLFDPLRFGEVNFNFGNRNQSYNSKIINMINEQVPDSINFDDFDLEYYKHYRLNLNGKYEISNGLLVEGGISYDWYKPVQSKDEDTPQLRKSFEVDDDIVDIIEDQYRSFAPVVSLTWTPCQYYRINGKKKEYVGSRFPTFSVEYARGIEGIFRSSSDYERIEADIQQKIPLGLMSSLQYYIGGGLFTNTESIYFADFTKFQRRNIPESWDDPIGGVFHLLGGEWYNASASYVQAHFMYESPFAILRLFRGVTKDIVKERIYLSQLYTPALPCYTELGYGVGNFLGNVGIFVSFERGLYKSLGVKFAFELGR